MEFPGGERSAIVIGGKGSSLSSANDYAIAKPKGTLEFGKEQMDIREKAMSQIKKIFKSHGAVFHDTPVFDLSETFMGKYGEDSELICHLPDQGGELCSMRYDLTVPFARHLAMYKIKSLKSYQISKVFRLDGPSNGTRREFYLCDFDIVGHLWGTSGADIEIIRVLVELLDQLNIGDYEIKLNSKKLLDAMLEMCGVSSEKLRTVCLSIDKLDKQSFEQIKKELVEEKGLSIKTAERIGKFVTKRGPLLETLDELQEMAASLLGSNQFNRALEFNRALLELKFRFKALIVEDLSKNLVFDFSVANVFEYYTGLIFRAFSKGSIQVGSIVAGGRYDNLVGMFSGKQVPVVGFSLNFERVFTIMEQLGKEKNASVQ